MAQWTVSAAVPPVYVTLKLRVAVAFVSVIEAFAMLVTCPAACAGTAGQPMTTTRVESSAAATRPSVRHILAMHPSSS